MQRIRPAVRKLEFKKRVHMRTDVPAPARVLRVSPLAVPVAAYWMVAGVMIYGMSSGAFPIQRWLTELEAVANIRERLPAAFEPREFGGFTAEPAPSPVVEPPAPAETPIAALQPAISPPVEREEPMEPAATAEREPVEQPARSEAPALSTAEQAARRAAFEREFFGLERRWEPPPPPREREPKAQPAISALLFREPPSLPPPAPRPDPPPPVAPRDYERAPEPGPVSYKSCEAALAEYSEELDMRRSSRRTPDLPASAFSAVLDNGAYLLPCGVPDATSVDICAAVQRGRAVGVTVVTRPANGRVNACVARAVARLSFPSSPRLDVARTRFEPAR